MRTSFLLLFLSVLFTSSPVSAQMVVGSDTLVGNEWIQYGHPYYKFSISEDGIYRITGETLQNAGIDLSKVNGSSIRLYALGKQVPVFLSTEDQFTSTDFIELYGHKTRSEVDHFLFRRPESDMLNPEVSMYTDKASYYLSFDGEGPAMRVTSLTNNVSNPPASLGYFNYPEQLLYSSSHFDPYITADGEAVSYSSFMHAEGFGKGSEPNTAINISAIDRAASGPDAILHIRMATTNNGVHSFPILWNEQLIVAIHPTNIQIVDTSIVFPLSHLQDNNVLRINSDIAISRFTIVSVTLTYPKSSAAALPGETTVLLSPNPQGQYFVFENFNHGVEQPIIYTSDGAQRMVTNFNGQNQVHFLWPAVQSETKLRLINPETGIHLITSLEEKQFTDWSTDNTQYIIITHPELMESGTASEYVQFRSSVEGGAYRAKAYSILDIYDQFGYGIEKHPQSIRNFVEFVHRHWPAAKMIFIVGRGIEYDRSRFENGTWESSFFVPTFGKPGSDQLLAATLWDLVPRYPIARLAVTDAATIHSYLNKVKEHDAAVSEGDQTLEDKEWIKHVIHISGGKDATEQEDFKFLMSELGKQLAATDFGAQIFSFEKTSSDFIGESQSRQIEKLLHEGSSIINYLGHSATSTFEFNIQDPTQWENKGHYPIFSGMGCSAGAIFSTSLSLSDRYVLIPDEGAIAFISGSGSQFASSLITWAEPWYQYFGSINYGTTLGLSVLYGLRAVGEEVDPGFTGINIFRYLLEQQTVQGDPAIRINPLPGPDYVVDRNSVVIAPAILNTRQDSFNLQFSTANIGRNLHQYVTYTVTLQSSGNDKIDLIHGSQLVDQFKDTISLRLPLLIDKKPGVYRLLISLDDENLVHELPAPDAESNNKLLDNLGVEGISLVIVDNLMAAAYPSNYAIVNKSPVELVAAGSNAFIEPSHVVLEIDTNGLFNSPFLIHQEFPDTRGVLKYSFDDVLIPGQEYFWRVSTDSVSPEQSYLWSKRSFTYLPDKSHGWSQSHFHQLTDDALLQITADSTTHKFDFARKVKNYTVLNRFHDVPASLVPYFFDDGRFIAKLFQTFRNSDVEGYVVAIDSATGNYFWNPPGGAYGSFGLAIPNEGFPYNLTTPESRQNLINLIENVIPPGYYVFFYTYQHTNYADYFPETWAEDEANFGKSIYSVIESQYPGSKIRTLADKGSVPYIVLFQKDRGGIQEQIAADSSDVISISFDGSSFFKSGSFLSTPIGPASQWTSIEHQVTTFNDTTGSVKLSAWAMSQDFADTLLIADSIVEPTLDISHIDAKAYPWIQLKMETLDSATFNPAKLDYWRVIYNGFPEFIINANTGFEFIADTLAQGETMSLLATIENVSDIDADSLPVSLNIIGTHSQTEELNNTLPAFPKHSSSPVYFERNTIDLEGDYQVVMEVNPDRAVPEQIAANNIGILPMTVLTDKVNPILDVTFDGAHIKDGDVVAAKPFILIKLFDENQFLRLTDTSLFDISLQFPSEFELKRIPFTSNWMTFIPAASAGANEARVELRPDLLEDGTYQLAVHAKDVPGNPSGDNDYFISFQVIHAQLISRIYNFPNPFTHSTQFIYTLTGEGSPAFYEIQIMSMDGILVRTITLDQMGPLVVGTHATHYEWNGTDNNGNPLSAGVYLYKMIARDEHGLDYGHYETYDENLFKNGWGKLIIVR